MVGSGAAMSAPAQAYANCERTASKPTFSGTNISGAYAASCTRGVPSATLYGRIKEDRPNTPDVVHDTESVTFTGSRSAKVTTNTCQNGDAIYTEAQINSEAATGSSRATMRC